MSRRMHRTSDRHLVGYHGSEGRTVGNCWNQTWRRSIDGRIRRYQSHSTGGIYCEAQKADTHQCLLVAPGGGQMIDEATTMPSIISYLNAPVAPVMNNPLPPPYVPPPPDPRTRGALRLSVNSINKFLGSPPIDYEDWELKTRATLGQTTYMTFLTTAPVAGDQAQAARNRELYNMFVTALHQGSGMHLLHASPTYDGHAAWQEIMTWYGSTATSRFIIDHYRNKLESLRLDSSTEASTYVNDFIICSHKLEAKSEGYTAKTKPQKFLD